MPVAATEKEAVWPDVTVWLVGCVLMDGATGAGLLLLETIPEHPEFTIASSTDNNTRAQRVILRLFSRNFLRREAGWYRNGTPNRRAHRLASRFSVGHRQAVVETLIGITLSPQLLAGPEIGP